MSKSLPNITPSEWNKISRRVQATIDQKERRSHENAAEIKKLKNALDLAKKNQQAVYEAYDHYVHSSDNRLVTIAVSFVLGGVCAAAFFTFPWC
jgi:hypothetical protein